MIFSWTVVETPRQRVGMLLDEALRETHTQHKEAWIAAGYGSGSSWTRALQGVPGYPLDLHRLIDALSPDTLFAYFVRLMSLSLERHGLPPETWFKFLPKLIGLMVELNVRGGMNARALRGADAAAAGDLTDGCEDRLGVVTHRPVRAQLKASRSAASNGDRDGARNTSRVG